MLKSGFVTCKLTDYVKCDDFSDDLLGILFESSD
jgi:hypothetical protein